MLFDCLYAVIYCLRSKNDLNLLIVIIFNFYENSAMRLFCPRIKLDDKFNTPLILLNSSTIVAES